MKRFVWTILTTLLAFGIAACGSSAILSAPPSATATAVTFLTQPTPVIAQPSPPPPAQTAAPAATATPTALPSPTPSATPSPLPTATNTRVFTPTPSPSPTATPAPQIQLPITSTNAVNIRSGPGTTYPVVEQLEPGQTAPVTGRNGDSRWWQVSLADQSLGWVLAELVSLSGSPAEIALADAPPLPPTAMPAPPTEAAPPAAASNEDQPNNAEDQPLTSQSLRQKLNCTQDFCITYQAMLPIWENGGCVGNHSIYVTVLQGPPPGVPMDGIVIGDTFNNVEVGSGDKGPGRTEFTLWNNTMSVKVKRHVDGTPFTSQESFPFTSADELIPAEVLAANGYCDGSVEKCRWAQQNNQVCRGHYSYRVTFHKLD